jgi:hypothetical protein
MQQMQSLHGADRKNEETRNHRSIRARVGKTTIEYSGITTDGL